MKAFFSIGPSFYKAETRKYAGWVGIYDLMLESLKEMGFEVVIPKYDSAMIDTSSTVSQITSWDLWAANQMPDDTDLFFGPPGYSLAQIMRLKATEAWMDSDNYEYRPKIVTAVFNNADWWRDHQLAEEYKAFERPYDLSPTWRWINKRALQLSDRIIACSPFVKDTHAKIEDVGPDKIGIAPWGVDSERFRPDWAWQESQRTPLRVLFVGSDPIRKGLSYLLAAVQDLDGVEVVVAGCQVPMAANRTLQGRLRVLGMVLNADMPAVMRQAHVICIPTLEDGIACSIQEGMASGLVPVTSVDAAEAFTGGPFQGGGGPGYVVPWRDIEGVKRVLASLRDYPTDRSSKGVTHSGRLELAHAARAMAEKQPWSLFKAAFKREITEAMK